MDRIGFVVRDGAGNISRGALTAPDQALAVGAGEQVSLNIDRWQIARFVREGDTLLIVMTDGRTVALEGFFTGEGALPNELYLSSDGALTGVMLTPGEGDALAASYEATATWGKWSPDDALIFYERAEIQVPEEQDGGFLAGWGVPLAAGAALLATTALARGGDDDDDAGDGGTDAAPPVDLGPGDDGDGGTDGGGRVSPSVDDTPIAAGGDDPAAHRFDVTGRAEPGSTVRVKVGDEIVTVVTGPGGNWSAPFEGPDFPSDGEFVAEVSVEPPSGDPVDLSGPPVLVDTTPPEVEITSGVRSTGDWFNAETFPDGVILTGVSEPGATLEIRVAEATQTVEVGEDGTWEAVFGGLEDGEWLPPVTIVASDEMGNSTTVADEVVIDTVAPPVDIRAVEGDDVVNAAEASDGVLVRGVSEPGAAVTVEMAGASATALTGPRGNWRVVFDAADLPGGTYDTTVTATASDEYGNASAASRDVHVDLEGAVAIDEAPIEGDDVVNAAEAADGVTVTGTVEAGSAVTVALGGATRQADVEGGTWSATFDAGAVGEGEAELTVAAEGTDAAGNVSTDSRALAIDTETSVTLDLTGPLADGLLNRAEAAGEVALSGTAEAGATVVVTAFGTSFEAQADADGGWAVTVPAGTVAPGAYDAEIGVAATDAAGNTATTGAAVAVDTEGWVAFDDAPVTADDLLNAAEAEQGLTLTGTTMPGSVVTVALGAATAAAEVAGDGSWSATFSADQIPAEEGPATATAEAVSPAGNPSDAEKGFALDTVTRVEIATPLAGDDVVNGAEAAEGLTVTGSAEPGAAVEVAFGGVTRAVAAGEDGAWSAAFAPDEIAPGTYDADILAVATDAAGNVATDTAALRVDTETFVTLDAPAPRDSADAGAPAVLTGTAEPGATVEVALGEASATVTADADGLWSAEFAAGDVPEGAYEAAIAVVATDAAGNSAATEGALTVDTGISVTFDGATAGADGVVNAAEAAAGVTLYGTTDPGAAVAVTMAGVTRSVTADGDGLWEAGFAADEIPEGEATAAVEVTATDAVGNSAGTAGEVPVDRIVDPLAMTDLPLGGEDGVVNAAERAAGLTVTGVVEAGSIVTVALNGTEVAATVAEDGSWSADLPAEAIPEGETTAELTASATDPAGNTRTVSETVAIDTDAGYLTISPEPVEGDDVVNAAEAADGVTIRGTATPGETVTVTLAGATATALSDADGAWEAFFAAEDIAAGTYEAPVHATLTDDAGNMLEAEDRVMVDTELAVAISDEAIEGDGVVNAAEAADGVRVSGTVDAGSEVQVRMGDATRAATVADDGTWTVVFSGAEIAGGEYTAEIVASATDAAGNTAEDTSTVELDTILRNLSVADDQVEEDGIVNAAERADGITITGTTEPGATVEVDFAGTVRAATVADDGTWSVDYAAAEVPEGETEVEVLVASTDAAGNSGTVTGTVAVDTEAPEAPFISSFTKGLTGVRSVGSPSTEDALDIRQVDGDGAVAQVDYTTSDNPAFGETVFEFNAPIPDGSHLVVTRTDEAGNQSGTLFALDETTTSELDLDNPGYQGFDIAAIDLTFASDTDLTITAEQLQGLSGFTDEAVIHGDQDDELTIAGARKTDETREIGGETYDVYSLGDDGARLVVDDEIKVII